MEKVIHKKYIFRTFRIGICISCNLTLIMLQQFVGSNIPYFDRGVTACSSNACATRMEFNMVDKPTVLKEGVDAFLRTPEINQIITTYAFYPLYTILFVYEKFHMRQSCV